MTNTVPYTRKGLEDLAVALGIDSAYLWIDPSRSSLSLRDSAATSSAGQGLATESVESSEEQPQGIV